GKPVRPLRTPQPMAAQLYRQTMSYRISGGIADRVFTNEIGGPPFTLEPDDVMTLRFRCRRGIDWGANWTLEQITALVDSLERPLSGQHLSLSNNGFGCSLLLVRRVPVLSEDSLDQDAQLRPHRLFSRPIDRGVRAHRLDQLPRNVPKCLVAENSHGAVICP